MNNNNIIYTTSTSSFFVKRPIKNVQVSKNKLCSPSVSESGTKLETVVFTALRYTLNYSKKHHKSAYYVLINSNLQVNFNQ